MQRWVGKGLRFLLLLFRSKQLGGFLQASQEPGWWGGGEAAECEAAFYQDLSVNGLF